jgi:hypothetical protein
MGMTAKNAGLAGIVLAAGLLSAAPASAEHFVVAEARGVGHWHAGNTIEAGTAVSLHQGQHLELISEDGTTIDLDGPYDGKVSSANAGGTSLMASFRAFFTEHKARTNESGTTRGQTLHTLPEPWLIDATRAGNACVRDAATPVFWRPDTKESAAVVVMPDDRSWKATETWPAGKDRLTVQTEVPMRPGGVYFVVVGGAEVAIKLTALPNTLSNDDMRAAWMADKGCEAQAMALARFSH